jgi:prevent-host-death family protein
MVVTVSIDGHEAEWKEALRSVRRGDEVLVTEGGTPVARLLPAGPPVAVHRRGSEDAGKVVIADDFDVLPEWLLDAFESLGEGVRPS